MALGLCFHDPRGLRLLAGLLLHSGDSRVPRDPADLCLDAVIAKCLSFVIDLLCQLLSRPDFEVRCSSDCCLGVVEDHRPLHPLCVQPFCSLCSLLEGNPYRQQLGVEHLHLSFPDVAAECHPPAFCCRCTRPLPPLSHHRTETHPSTLCGRSYVSLSTTLLRTFLLPFLLYYHSYHSFFSGAGPKNSASFVIDVWESFLGPRTTGSTSSSDHLSGVYSQGR